MMDTRSAFAAMSSEQLVSSALIRDGRLLSEQCSLSQPFPHVVIDNFFNPEVATTLAREISSIRDNKYRVSFRSLTQKKLQLGDIQGAVPHIYPLYDAMMGPSFARVIEIVSGYPDLEADRQFHRSRNATVPQGRIQRNSSRLKSSSFRPSFTSPGKSDRYL